jgi:signal peptidase I
VTTADEDHERHETSDEGDHGMSVGNPPFEAPQPAAGAGAAAAADPREHVMEKGILRDYFETIVICVIFVVFARAFVFQQSKIPTGSMIPTLLIGDYIMVNKFMYAPTVSATERSLLPIRDIRRGDIIVFKYPEEPEKDYIKRVIGLPGEFIEMRNKTVHINGVALDEPYKAHEGDMKPESWAKIREGEAPLSAGEHLPRSWPNIGNGVNFGPVLIPEGHYFCMGDNRDNSRDSRSWGTVPRENVKGKAFIIWWSFSGEENDHIRTGLLERARSIAYKLIYFIPKSRFKRCLRFIS